MECSKLRRSLAASGIYTCSTPAYDPSLGFFSFRAIVSFSYSRSMPHKYGRFLRAGVQYLPVQALSALALRRLHRIFDGSDCACGVMI